MKLNEYKEDSDQPHRAATPDIWTLLEV